MRDLTELNKLEKYLKENAIPYERFDQEAKPGWNSDWHQIIVPSKEVHDWDAICHYGSYGVEEGLLEIYGLIVDETIDGGVEGWLTADDVIERIERHDSVKLCTKHGYFKEEK